MSSKFLVWDTYKSVCVCSDKLVCSVWVRNPIYIFRRWNNSTNTFSNMNLYVLGSVSLINMRILKSKAESNTVKQNYVYSYVTDSYILCFISWAGFQKAAYFIEIQYMHY